MIIRDKGKGIRIKLAFSLILFSFCFFSFGFTADDLIPVIKFKDADIRVVLQSIAHKAVKDGKKVNIAVSPDIEGLVSISLEDVSWLSALEVVLKMHGYTYEWLGEDTIIVMTLDKLAEKREREILVAESEPLEIITYRLKSLDAHDVKKLLEPQLTPRGRVTVLEIEPQRGWKGRGKGSSGEEGGELERAEREKGAKPRTNTLVITDTKSKVRELLRIIEEIDIMPKQVLIEARIMEVSSDFLKDIGIDWGTGTTGASSSGSLEFINVQESPAGINISQAAISAIAPTPSIFGAKATNLDSSDFRFAFRKLAGTQFEVILHALEEDVNTNTLSAPRIVTLDGQEAYIMVGEKRPIIRSTLTSSQNSVGISKELDYYQNLGIELNVIPQITDTNYINMIIYPSVTSSSQNIDAVSQIGDATSTDSYPIILVREVQTQVLMKDGETIAIGGLIKDVKSKSEIGIPILKDIPFIGRIFRRETEDTGKIELVIFITATIVKPGELTPVGLFNTGKFLSKFEEK